MIHVIGASSLSRAVNDTNHRQKQILRKSIIAVPSLSLNPNVKSPLKNLSFLLENGSLKTKSNLVIWHDVLNNSLTSHKSNNFSPASPHELVRILSKYRSRIAALVYCQRLNAPYIFNILRSSNFIVIRVNKNLTSRRRQTWPTVTKELLALHQSVNIELKSLSLVFQHSNNLKGLSQNTRRPTKKASQRKRKLAKAKIQFQQ